jgi:hypothetical protein
MDANTDFYHSLTERIEDAFIEIDNDRAGPPRHAAYHGDTTGEVHSV